jgi:hypothetical protein
MGGERITRSSISRLLSAGGISGAPWSTSVTPADPRHVMATLELRAVGLAAGGGVIASAAWYTAFGKRLARLDEAYAEGSRPPAWVMPVELARNAAVATAVAMLADGTCQPQRVRAPPQPPARPVRRVAVVVADPGFTPLRGLDRVVIRGGPGQVIVDPGGVPGVDVIMVRRPP